MRPLSVTIERFGSFVEAQTFAFPDGPGLFFMQGRNEVEPKLGSNGAGKSTLWKALTWCLFGKDPRGLKAGDVANWETPKGAFVSFEYEVVADNVWMGYKLTRTHAPNKWVLVNAFDEAVDLAKDETNPMLDMLRLEYSTWLMTVLMAQGEPYFLDLRADAKASVFSEVMGLDRWIKYSERAGDRVKDNELLERTIERMLGETEGELRALGSNADYLVGASAKWEDGRRQKLDELSNQHRAGTMESVRLKEKLEEAETAADFAHSGVVGDQGTIDRAQYEVGRLQEAHQRRVEHFAGLRERLRGVTESLDALNDNKGRCPLCGNDDDGSAMDSLAQQADRLESEVEQAGQQADLAAKDLRAASNRLQQAQDASQTALRAVDAAQRALSNARVAYEAQERKLDDIENECERAQATANPFDEQAAAAAGNRRRLEVERDAIEAKHVQCAERGALLGFWVRGFKDVRLALIAEALDQYALEANSCAQALGLSGWELVFEVDRETKSGAVRSGFNVYVRSPHNDRQVPWEAWSGGEGQRLRLAAQLGLSNLIRATTGADIALEVWDEPTEGMSDAGIADLLAALADRARVEGRQIWVVDHRVLGYAGWDGVVTVVKTRQGSRFD